MNPVLWLHYARPRSRWYDVPPAERERMSVEWLRADDASVAAGAERLGVYRVRGQSDWSTVSVWRFADVDAAFAHWEGKVRAGYVSWFAFSNAMGSDAAAGLVAEVES